MVVCLAPERTALGTERVNDLDEGLGFSVTRRQHSLSMSVNFRTFTLTICLLHITEERSKIHN